MPEPKLAAAGNPAGPCRRAVDGSRRSRRRASTWKRSVTEMLSDLLAELPGFACGCCIWPARITAKAPTARIDRRVVYRSAASIADPGLPPLDGLVVAVHSPRAGTRLAELAERAQHGPLSPRSAMRPPQPCGDGWERDRQLPTEPNDKSLLALAASCATNRRRMTAEPIPTRLFLDSALRLGAAAAARRSGAGHLGPVALGERRAFFRGRARASRCRSSARPASPVQPRRASRPKR